MRQRISSGAPWEPRVGYSRAVRVGRRVWVSGTTALRAGRIVAPGDPYRQAVRALEIVRAALREAGAGLDDVVRTRVYLVDDRHWSEVGRAHGKFFGRARPACTMVRVAGLIDPAMLVEIEAEAVIPRKRTRR